MMAQALEDWKQSDIGKMFEAAKKGATGEVENLLAKGISPDSRDDKERTPLIIAAEHGNADMVEMLLNQGADVNAVDVDGDTPLTAASYGGHIDVVKLLVANGAPLYHRNNEGSTALKIAQEMEVSAVTAFLSAHSITPTALAEAAVSQKPEPQSYVNEAGLDLSPDPTTENRESEETPEEDESDFDADSTDEGLSEDEVLPKMTRARDDVIVKSTGKRPVTPNNILAENEERIEFDALDNKQVRNINEKIKGVLDKAGFGVGDYVIDTVFKGNPMAVLKPRSQENKRWRKLKKHPDWIIDPRRLTELIGGCAARRLCLAEGIDVSPFSLSHFIELYYAKDLKLILTLAEEASTNNYTVRQLKRAVEELREHEDDHDPGKEIIKTLDQPVPLLEDPDLMALCSDKDRVLEELSKAERKKIRALIKSRKPGLDEWKNLMDTFEEILSKLENE
jgi:hypothetical protein